MWLSTIKMDALAVAFLLVIISRVLAAYELNLFLLFVTKLAYSREVQMYQHCLMSSSNTFVLRRRHRYRCQRATRRYWIRLGRTRSLWNNFVSNVVSPEEWKENFRMSRCTFYALCEQLGPHIERLTTRMWEPVEVDWQVAISLYYLADEGRMRKTANSFGVSCSSGDKQDHRETINCLSNNSWSPCDPWPSCLSSPSFFQFNFSLSKMQNLAISGNFLLQFLLRIRVQNTASLPISTLFPPNSATCRWIRLW